jgi:gamma-glutamylcyclotransferase (GGCT)/AIG2-like uncharacterized protein YtfP
MIHTETAMSENTTIYFAYGANLNRNHMALWCPNATPLETATLADHRLVFRFWCDLLPARSRQVAGALYRLGPGDLRWLDEYEDCPRLYEHKTVLVRTATGGEVEALTYQMKVGHPCAPPEAEYLAIVRQGFVDWGYDPALLPS